MDQQRYNGLDDLLERSPYGSEFFEKLPAYVQEMIRQRSDNIYSMDVLRRYAENLVQGDK